jgi:hypothetical protein
MKRKRRKMLEYHSMEEYRRKFYPSSYQKHVLETDDPQIFGVNLARESLDKVRRLLSKK